MDQRIEPAGKAAKRPAPAKRSWSATELAADCVRVAQAMSEAMTERRDEVLRDPSSANVHAFRGALRSAAGALKLFKPEVGVKRRAKVTPDRRAALSETVARDRDAIDLAGPRYEAGVASFITVLDAERTLQQHQFMLADGQAAVSTDLVILYKALGGGWA